MRSVNKDGNRSDNTGDEDDARLNRLAADVDQVVRKASRTVEFGMRGFAIALTVFALLVAELLVWVDASAGWQLTLGAAGYLTILLVFAFTSIGSAAVPSAVAL